MGTLSWKPARAGSSLPHPAGSANPRRGERWALLPGPPPGLGVWGSRESPRLFTGGTDSKGVEAADADFPGFWEDCPAWGVWGGGVPPHSHGNRSRSGTFLMAQWLRVCCQWRGHGFDPWSRKIPRTAEQQSQ